MTPPEDVPVIQWFSQADLSVHAALATPHLIRASVEAEQGDEGGAGFFTGATAFSGNSDAVVPDLDVCRARLRRAGFSTLSYGAFEVIGRRVLVAHLLQDLAPVSFVRPYFENVLYEVDPRFAEVWRSGFPVAWSIDRVDDDAQRSGERRKLALAALLRTHAMNSGVILSLSAPQLGLNIGVSLTSERQDADWIDDRAMGTALAVSLAVHRCARPFLESRAGWLAAISLNADQEAVLARLVQGLSDQEIADALDTSLHKVGHHIQALERAFNVHNRAQLAYMAARRAVLVNTGAGSV